MKYLMIILAILFTVSCDDGGGDDGGGPKDTTPPLPVNISGTNGDGQVILNWGPPTDQDADSIFLEQQVNSGGFTLLRAFSKTTLTFTAGNLTNYNLYGFRLFVTDLAGNVSEYSNTATFTPTNGTQELQEGWDFVIIGNHFAAITEFNQVVSANLPTKNEARVGLAWAYYLNSGGANNNNISQAVINIGALNTLDSHSGRVLIRLVESRWSLALESANLVDAADSYTHTYLPWVTQYYIRVNGAIAAFYEKDYDKVVDYLSRIDPEGSYNPDPQELWVVLQNLSQEISVNAPMIEMKKPEVF